MEQSDINKAKLSCIGYYDKVHEEYFSKYYDEFMKKSYDVKFLIRFISNIEKGNPVLDIGCGPAAQSARFLHKVGFKVTAIDLSGKCIETAKKNFQGIEFIQMDMTEMDFAEKLFNGINASYSIIHIPNEKLDSLFYDFNRILKLNGKIGISVHAGDFYGYYNENGTPVFYRTYTETQLTNLLTKSQWLLNISTSQVKTICLYTTNS